MNETLERTGLEQRSFDPEARRYYDTVTWLAEVLPGSMRTPFEYGFDGHELYAEDGSALEKVFDDAIVQARQLPPYELRRRLIEKEEYKEMIEMMRSNDINTMVVVSDFPPELMNAVRDVGGYNAERKQTMLRVLTKTTEGTLRMYSQSLDGSNRQALEEIYNSLGYAPEPGELLGQRMHLKIGSYEQEFLVDQLMGVYDRSLHKQFGGEWYAGRRGKQIDTYNFVCGQRDLIKAYLAVTDSFTGGDYEYNLAAAIQARLNGSGMSEIHSIIQLNEYCMPAIAAHTLALEEMNIAGGVARQLGTTFSGCGATISSNSESKPLAESQTEELGYGNKADKLPDDKYGSRYFICPKKSCRYENTRPENTLIPRCKKCGTDVSCGANEPLKKSFMDIIENSFGKQAGLRKEAERSKAWLN